MTTFIDAIQTNMGIAACVVLAMGVLTLVAWLFRARSPYVLIASIVCFVAGGILMGMATDIISFDWSALNTTPTTTPAETTG